MPNIRDVAKRAGVSIATVSRIMNRDESYRTTEQTQKKVWQAATELGYVLPDRTLRLNIAQKGHMVNRIGCIVKANLDKFIDPYYQSVLDGVQRYLRSRDMDPAMVFDGKDLEQPQLHQSMLQARLGALIILSYDLVSREYYESLSRAVPILVCVSDILAWSRHDLVTYDHAHAISLAMAHLFDRGHTRVAYIGGASQVQDQPFWREPRCRAYLDEMQERGLAVEPAWMINCRWSRRQCHASTLELLNGPYRPTAILAGSDNMAAVVLKALYDLRLHVPNDVAVVGLSDLVFARYTTPSLTTVHVPVEEIGEQAAELAVRRLGGDDSMKRHVLFPTSLVIREST